MSRGVVTDDTRKYLPARVSTGHGRGLVWAVGRELTVMLSGRWMAGKEGKDLESTGFSSCSTTGTQFTLPEGGF